jgi:prepilin-type processing-associated H-X9-DG protein
VFTLSFIEQDNLLSIYRLDKNWDAPENQAAITREVKTFICPSATNGRTITLSPGSMAATDYTPITRHEINAALLGGAPSTGPATYGAMPSDGLSKNRRAQDIRDGVSNTILIAECAGSPELWTNGKLTSTAGPQMGWAKATIGSSVLTFAVDGALPNGQVVEPSTAQSTCAFNCSNNYELYSMHPQSLNTVFADGHTVTLRNGLNIRIMAALITRNGGEIISSSDYE